MEPRDGKAPAPLPGVEQLVQRLGADRKLADLALPPSQQDALRAIALRARRPADEMESRTHAAGTPAPTGVTALFAGSDRAKQAAVALADELGREIYRVDLSRVASKYIGETEKNLSRVFDAAESAGWVLFFDEADALFGKRTDVKDSHHRYANIDINYLLERLEAYQGLAILATNLRKESIDEAFIRHIRHIVSFADR